MDRLLALMLFVYYKYTVHLIPKDIRHSLDVEIEGITDGAVEAREAVVMAKRKVGIASRQHKPILLDLDGQPISAEKPHSGYHPCR